jgi:class 3 adenylate cyclase
MAAGLLDFWLSNNVAEGRRWLEEALGHVPEHTPDRARGLLAAGTLAMIQQSHAEARQVLGESLAICVACGDRRGEAWARTTLGALCWMADDPAASRLQLERSVSLHEEQGDRFGLARSLIHLGTAISVPGGEAAGRDHLARGVAMAEEFGDRWGQAYGLLMLGLSEIDAGEPASAAERFRRALEARVGTFMGGPIEGLADLVVAEDPRRAMRLLGAAMGIRARFGGRPPPVHVRRIERIRAVAEAQLGPDAAQRAWEEGHRMPTEEALAYALEPAGAVLTKPLPGGGSSWRDRPHRLRRTFMFTDIVRSTNLVEAMGDDAWDHLLRWHDETLRSLFAGHGGEEVKRVGDGFFVAFPDPGAGVNCAMAIQRTLARQRSEHGFAPEVRVGLHEAEATRLEDDYQGEAVHVAARIAALAEGGEILASQPVIAGIGGVGASAARSVTLRGLSKRVEIAAIAWQ